MREFCTSRSVGGPGPISARAYPTTSGKHVLGISATEAAPVTLSVTLDGTEIIRFVDGATGALPAAGMAGMFDYNGASQPLDAFQVIRP